MLALSMNSILPVLQKSVQRILTQATHCLQYHPLGTTLVRLASQILAPLVGGVVLIIH
jgi:hypothetical protein